MWHRPTYSKHLDQHSHSQVATAKVENTTVSDGLLHWVSKLLFTVCMLSVYVMCVSQQWLKSMNACGQNWHYWKQIIAKSLTTNQFLSQWMWKLALLQTVTQTSMVRTYNIDMWSCAELAVSEMHCNPKFFLLLNVGEMWENHSCTESKNASVCRYR